MKRKECHGRGKGVNQGKGEGIEGKGDEGEGKEERWKERAGGRGNTA